MGDWCIDRKHPIVFTDGGGNEYCVFHAPEGKKGISREEFDKKVFEEIYRVKEENRTKNEKRTCDLSGTVFEWDISFREFDKDNPFPEINFSEAVFIGKTNFSSAEFSKKAYFRGAEFNGKAYFSSAKFSGEVYFYGANFSKKAYFSEAEFKEAAFSFAKFSGEADFYNANFSGTAEFSGAQFSKEEAYFYNANFSGTADFSFAKFKNTLFHSASFKGRAIFKDVAIEERLCFQNLELKKPSFLGTDLHKCDFTACRWHEEDGRRILYDETELMEEEEKRLAEAKAGWLKKLWAKKFSTTDAAGMKQVEDLYRTMKQKSRDKHDEFAYSHWHYSEKEMQRKSTGPKRLFHFTVLNLYWLLNGYGEEPKRAGLLLLALIFGISGLMWLTTFVPLEEAPVWITDLKGFWKMIGYGFSTLQYITFHKEPVFVPSSFLGEGLTLFARIAVPIQVAFVVMALRNRFRR